MKRNYELHELNEFRYLNFAAKAANVYEYSYPFATKSQNLSNMIRAIRKIRS